MKIEELNQNPAVFHAVNGRADRSEPTDANGSAAKPQSSGDKVELSGFKLQSTDSIELQDARASRVEELRSKIESGSYQVTGRAVAEKMLSKSSGS